MCWNRIGLWASLCLFLVTFAACENPGAIGEDLIGGLEGAPEAEVVLASTFAADTIRDVTGNRLRVLAGRVVDPLLGTMSATGYLDFNAVTTPEAFRNGTATAAELRLVPDYTYGSTANPVTLRLNALREEIATQNARSDTTLPASAIGDFIITHDVDPSDTLVVIPLPAEFVAANDTTFRSTRFATSFHGFQISSAGDAAIRGFDVENSVLRVVAGGDTVNFPINKVLSTLDRETQPSLPEGYLLIQDGFGSSARFDFAFEDSLSPSIAINRVAFALAADTLALQADTPPGFMRPLLREVTLYALQEDSIAVRLNLTGSVDYRLDDERFLLVHPQLINIAQFRLQGDELFAGFRLTPDVDANTIDPILLYTGDLPVTPDKNEAPQATVTLTPTE